MRFSLVFFDLDGTLVDSLPDIGWALNQALVEHGLAALPLPLVRTLIGEGVMRLAERALAHQPAGQTVDAQALGERTRAIYTGRPCAETTVYPGVRETLAALRQPDRRLVLLTNKPGEVTRPLMQALQLDQSFDLVVGDGDGFPRKPDPTGARSIVQRFGLEPHQALVVGDGVPDLQVGRALGAGVVGVTWGYNDRATLELHRPHHLIDAPAELMQIA